MPRLLRIAVRQSRFTGGSTQSFNKIVASISLMTFQFGGWWASDFCLRFWQKLQHILAYFAYNLTYFWPKLFVEKVVFAQKSKWIFIFKFQLWMIECMETSKIWLILKIFCHYDILEKYFYDHPLFSLILDLKWSYWIVSTCSYSKK